MSASAPALARRVLLLFLLGAVVVSSGCGLTDPMRNRIGCLPFPGMFTLYRVADPDNLGVHHHRSAGAWFSDEADRGLIYTCEAGFLDIAHVRDTADLAHYFHGHYHAALTEGRTSLELKCKYPSTFHITLNYPEDWESLDAQTRRELIDDLAIRFGLQLAWISANWHEIITWFGYKSTIIIPEHQSAFTYDDMFAHVAGLEVARRALRADRSLEIDDAVTLALEEVLDEYGAVSVEQTARAVEAVKGMWWDEGRSLKRHIDIGLDDNEIEPWLIPGFSGCPDAIARSWPVPPLRDTLGPCGEPFIEILIEPDILESWLIRAHIPGEPDLIDPGRDFPFIMEHLREVFEERLGAGFDSAVP